MDHAVVVQSLSCVQLFATPWTAAHQASLSVTISQSLLKSMPIKSCHLTMSSSATPFSFCLQPFPESGSFQWGGSSYQVAKVLELQLQHQSFPWIFKFDFLQGWLVWSPCCPRDSQKSSPAPQFESLNSLALSLLYGPALTSMHDYWKNDSFDYMDLSRQTNILCFLICSLGLS